MGVDYYGVLEIERSASSEDIRRGFARTAIRCHPKRPYPECPPDDLDLRLTWFQLAGEAYEVLSDPLLRAAYDKFGEVGLKNGVPARDPELFFPPYTYHGDALKTYRNFFGTESPSEPVLLEWQSSFLPRKPAGVKGPWFREKPEEVVLPVTLEKVVEGGEAVAVMSRREMHNGFLEVREHHITVDLRPGTPNGSSFLFPQQGHEAPFSIPGDVLVVTNDLPHPMFSREKHDLIIHCRVSLTEALLGCVVQVPTLDGRLLRINVTDVITPSYELRIPGEGMPICPKSVPPSPLEPPSRKCYLMVPGWVKGSLADCKDKMGPCSTCGQTADCCALPDTHDLSGSCRTLFPAVDPDEGSMSLLRSFTGGQRESSDAKKKRHASFDSPQVESVREELLKRFPSLFDSRDMTYGDLVIRFKIDFPQHVPGFRRDQLQEALDGLVETPERRVIFNKKY